MPRKELPEDSYFYSLSEEALWHRYCGFLGLSPDDFNGIQERLLLEQIDFTYGSILGKAMMGDTKPRSVAEFRQKVPLTTYVDYEPYLKGLREDALAKKPFLWMHTSGRSGNFKYVPFTEEALDVATRHGLATFILASAHRKGEVNLRPGQRALLLAAPPPYFSGSALEYICKRRFSLEAVPPLETAETLEFPDRVALGFKIGLRTGFDHMYALASLLAKMGEAMANHTSTMKPAAWMLHPAVLARLGGAWLRSVSGRRSMLPLDLWQTKSIVTGGADAQIYWNDIAHYWGTTPWQAYAATETYLIALQAWNRKGMTFVPNMAFWEFIPDEERRKEAEVPGYRPKTVLYTEMEPGKEYEVVLSHFHGMPFVRYRMSDIIRCIGTSDPEAGIALPQVVFRSRVGDIIQMSGLTELDERTIWQALVNTGVKIEDWSAGKEYEGGRAYVRIYLEAKEPIDPDQLAVAIDQQLRNIDADYRDVGDQLGHQPVRVTPLSRGTFARYYEEKHREGADLAHLKPPHMNPSQAVIDTLLRYGR